MAQQIEEGETVKVHFNDSTRNFIGEYKGIKQADYGKAHMVDAFTKSGVYEIAVSSNSETVEPHSVI